MSIYMKIVKIVLSHVYFDCPFIMFTCMKELNQFYYRIAYSPCMAQKYYLNVYSMLLYSLFLMIVSTYILK